MTAAQYTPGPWRVERQPLAYEIVSASAHMSASVARIHARAGSKTCEADARLIAAAPELLTVADHPVLDWLLGEGIENIPEPQRTSVRLFLVPLRDAAIAKALGE